MSAATQGQHLRLQFGGSGMGAQKHFLGFSTDLQFHVSSSLEDATTKDTTDGSGLWQEQEKTKINIDGSLTAILETAEGQNLTQYIQEGELDWELDWVGGNMNRVVATKICSGSQMLLSNVEISAPRDGFATLTGNFVIFGAIAFT